MCILFEPFTINGMVMPNRFVRSATYDGMADMQGHITDAQSWLLEGLAEGCVGLIIVGAVHVHPLGALSPVATSIATDDCIPGLRRLAESIHARGDKVAVQLFHAGKEAIPFLSRLGAQALAPSHLPDDRFPPDAYKALREDEIWEIVSVFGDAATRAEEAGIDAVQIHGAAHFLLSQFLSPLTNQRDDGWGGSLENRLRIHREIIKDIRSKVSETYPVLLKLGIRDAFDGGLRLEEGLAAAELLGKQPLDAIEVHHGLGGYGPLVDETADEPFLRVPTSEVRALVDMPVIVVGGIRTYDDAESAVLDGVADLVALSRPLIREPNLLRDWQNGDRHRATCISCNGCLQALGDLKPLHCVIDQNSS